MAVFSNIIQQKWVLDAGELFPHSHVWDNHPSFHRKNLQRERLSLQQNLTFDHLYLLKTKPRKPVFSREMFTLVLFLRH